MDHWDDVRALFERCVDMEPEERARLLFAAHPEVRIEVEDLLDVHEQGAGLFPQGGGAVGLSGLADLRLEVGQRIGAYRLLEELGRGGIGTIYRAEQIRPRRAVAIKVLSAPFVGPRSRQRFQREIELLSTLRHEGVAQVYVAGFAEVQTGLGGIEVPYYVREYVENARTLDVWRNECVRTRDEILRVVVELARALQHAHERGVVHQDLKPLNVLIDGASRIKVIDFSSARLLSDSDGSSGRLTHRVGTPAYMAPEQFGLDSGVADTRVDVYGLGLTTLELLAGRPVFEEPVGDMLAVAEQVRNRVVPPLRELCPGESAELESILRRATALDPSERYGVAGSFADDLARFRAGREVSAHPGGLGYKLRVVMRSYPIATGSLLALGLLIALLGVLAWFSTLRALEAERELGAMISKRSDAAFLAVQQAMQAISVAPVRLTYEVSNPDAQRARWIELALSQLDIVEQALPPEPGLSLAIARALSVIERARAALPESKWKEDLPTDLVERATQHIERFIETRKAQPSLMDVIDFEIGVLDVQSTTSVIAKILLSAAAEEAGLSWDAREAARLQKVLAIGERSIGLGELADARKRYVEELARQRNLMPTFAESRSLPVAMLELRRRLAGIDIYLGNRKEGQALLRELLELNQRIPLRLSSAERDREIALAQSMLGSSLIVDGQVIEGERWMTAASEYSTSTDAAAGPASRARSLLWLRVADFLVCGADRHIGEKSSDVRRGEAAVLAEQALNSVVDSRPQEFSVVSVLLELEAKRILERARM